MNQRLIATTAALALAAGLAACGSKAAGVQLAPQSGATGSSAAGSSTTASTTTPTTATTPTSGPLSKEPAVVKPTGPAPTKLVTKDLITGTGATAKTGSSVTVNYVGYLYKTGAVFDASWKRHQAFGPFTLGQGAVIPGWDTGLIGMKVGGRRELIIPPSLAYKNVARPGIPANSTLVFVVDLLGAS